MKRYEEKFFLQRAEEEEKETPLQRLEVTKTLKIDSFDYLCLVFNKNENKRLTATCLRSEFENEMLALELVNDRIRLKGNLHTVSECTKRERSFDIRFVGRRTD